MSTPTPYSPQAPKLELRQSQSLVMTPQLQQAISLLQMNNLELEAHVHTELETNPFLELDDGSRDQKKADKDAINNTDIAPDDINRVQPESQTSKIEMDDSNVWTGNDAKVETRQVKDTMPTMAGTGGGGSHSFDHPDFSLENRLSDEPSLHDHIKEQLNIEFSAPQDRLIAIALMDSLDEAGYLGIDLIELSTKIGADIYDVEGVLARCQTFDPIGVFAVDLAQCLEIQIRDRDRFTPKMSTLLANLDLIGRGDLEKLKRKCACDDLTLQSMLAEIRTLNPKPAAKFSHVVSQTLIPDVLMRKNTDADSGEGWIIELNPDTLPKVLVNNSYYTEIKKSKMARDEKNYVTERMNAASFLTKALDQRAHTILKVASEIVRQQEMFFAYGVQYLKPLVLRDIAEIIDMHESTVSRVTTNKYIETPRGIFELKYFFSSSLSSKDGGMTHSSQAVKARIKDLIESEDLKKILSDDAIADTLKAEGIDIARRTVAKYRESMSIGSSSARRRAKKMAQ